MTVFTSRKVDSDLRQRTTTLSASEPPFDCLQSIKLMCAVDIGTDLHLQRLASQCPVQAIEIPLSSAALDGD